MRKLTYDPLVALMEYYEGKKSSTSTVDRSTLAVDERLKGRIIDGDRIGLDDDLAEALKTYPPLEIINTFLLDGMKVVGELFGAGKMQLPFVLQSAETMKTAVSYLEPYMEKSEDRAKGTMVIATVKGDVHDIGKNLVDIILTNNGYRVINLGIKVPVEQMLEAVEQHRANAIGMSGLLVKSTLVMKENLQIMRDRDLEIPVVLGGAALNRRYVEEDLREVYGGNLAYAADAFDGLRFMDRLAAGEPLASSPSSDAVDRNGAEGGRQRLNERGSIRLRLAADRTEVDAVARLSGSAGSVYADAPEGEVMVAELAEGIVGWGRLRRIGNDLVLLEGIGAIPEQGKTGAVLDLVRGMVAEARKESAGTRVLLPADQSDKRGMMLWKGIGFEQVGRDDERVRDLDETLVSGKEEQVAEPALLLAKPGLGVGKGEPNDGEQLPSTGDDSVRSDVSRMIPVPEAPFFGSRVVENVPLEKIFEYLNEVALIRGQWGVKRGSRPADEYRRELEEKIYPKLEELKLVAKREGLLVPKVIYGYFPCKSHGNRLIVYRPAGVEGEELYREWENIEDVEWVEWQTFDFPRQSAGRRLCLSDFFRSVDEEGFDVLPLQIVTVGAKASEYTAKLFAEGNYSDYLYFHGLSVETAEGLAEYWHRSVRIELGIADEDAADVRKLFSQGYRGSRYSFGYPACPDLEDQRQLFAILRPERIGVELTDEFMLDPEQSTSALVVHHPEAKYFNV